MNGFDFPPPRETPESEALRAEVRGFLKQELPAGPAFTRIDSWSRFDADFTRKMAGRGWIGMTWPRKHGGHGRSALERYVVLEEMLAAGAPVAAHWIADRQSGPLILKHGTPEQRQTILPRIAAGECYFCIGMSEPDSGSDLAAVRTRAVEAQGGFVVNGSKLWTTYAHLSHYMILFCRTDDGEKRHQGMSQFLVDMSLPGITVGPIIDIAGEHRFNEVSFTDVFLSADCLIGERGRGWDQVMQELSFERSGPERFLSSFALLAATVERMKEEGNGRGDREIGRLAAHLLTLRRLSRSVAGMLDRGEDPQLQAALVKDLGSVLEQEIPERLRLLIETEPTLEGADELAGALAYTMLNAPGFSLRGGTREILRGIIARGLGLR